MARPGCILGALHGQCRRKGGSRVETVHPLEEPRGESGHTVTEEMQKWGVMPEEQTTLGSFVSATRSSHPTPPPWPPQTITGDPDDLGEFEERANGQL